MSTAFQRGPFGEPSYITAAMAGSMIGQPLLYSIKRIGPKRVKWIGNPPRTHGTSISNAPTCWSLDGKRAKHSEIVKAAHFP